MAEYVFRDLAARRGMDGVVACASAATSAEELGNPVYPPAARKLRSVGIDCSGKRARQLTKGDYDRYDLLLGMEERNLRDMRRICGGDALGKIRLLLQNAPRPRDIADPWWTGDFDTAYRDILEGCTLLLEEIRNPG